MAEHNSSNLSKLAPEILKEIFSFLPKPSLLRLRGVNTVIGAIATPLAFRHVQLRASKEEPRIAGFVQIAQSEKLRGFVHEVTCDPGFGSPFHYWGRREEREIPQEFMNALPYLRLFQKLTALHLRFNENCGEEDEYKSQDFETNDFRYWVLDVVFQCLAGTWSAQRQADIDSGLDLDIQADYGTETWSSERTVTPLQLKELTVSNLGDFHDKRLTESEAFKAVLSSTTLKDLKLLFTTETCEASSDDDFYLKEKYDFFESLPSTWLSPSVAGNLTTLSLFCRNYWGWSPRMDFRAIRPGRGPDSGFPNLRVLALGRFIFSHEWQIEWFASLGKQNKYGGLEELYLDDCRIMFHGRHENNMDHGETVIGKDMHGKDVVISNDGYYKSSLIHRRATSRNYNATLTPWEYPLRWHMLLTRWRESMAALKVFEMGQGSLFPTDVFGVSIWPYDNTSGIVDAMESIQKPEDDLYTGEDYRDSAFRSYDFPAPPPRGTEPNDIDIAKYAQGCGLSKDSYQVLRYQCFSGNSWVTEGWPRSKQWNEESQWYPGGPKLEAGTKAMDQGALEALLSAVEARRIRG